MPSVPRQHTGILREENHILRQVFGYNDQLIHPDPLPQTGSPLPGSSIKVVLLVSVDVNTGGGYEVISPDQSFHVGISIFDTRCLTSNDNLTDPLRAITSYQFINRDTKPCKRAAKRFSLGATEMQTDYILVAHGINEDLKFLNNINPDIAARACYILDTVKAAQYTLQLYYRYSLEKLLEALGIPLDHPRLHAAGNDAFFALKGLLMIVARDMSAKRPAWTLGSQRTMDTLEAIARAPYPLLADEPHKSPTPERPAKLSIGAKRRSRAARKAARQATKDLTSTGELGQDGSHDVDGTLSNNHDTATSPDLLALEPVGEKK